MTIEQAKEFLRDCTDEQKEQFAIIGVLTGVRLFTSFIRALRGDKIASK